MPTAFKNRCLVAGALAWLFLAVLENRADYDTWIYLNFGRAFWSGPGFLSQDIFAYTPVHDLWIFHEWLTGVILYPLLVSFGPLGLQLLRYTLVLGTCWAAFSAARQRGGRAAASLVCLVLAVHLFQSGFMPVRAQGFTYFFFAFCLYAAEAAQREDSARRLWLLVPLFVLWANLHAGFLAGIGLVAIYTAGRALARRPWRNWVLVWVACSLATLVNPHTVQLWKAVLFHAAGPQEGLLEWMSLPQALAQWFNGPALVCFSGLALVCLALAVGGWIKDLPARLLLLVTAVLGFVHIRHVPLFALCLAVYVPAALDGWLASGRTKRKKIMAGAVLLPCLALAGLHVAQNALRLTHPSIFGSPFTLVVADCTDPAATSESCYPLGALEFIDEKGLSGRLIAHYEWAAFCSWNLYPRSLVAMDGRCETLFPELVRDGYFSFLWGGPQGGEFLMQYPADLALVKQGTGAMRILSKNPQWREAYSDSQAAVFVSMSGPYPKKATDPGQAMKTDVKSRR